MRIALVHDFLTQLGGAERVLAVLHEMFPEAPLYTLIHDAEKTEGVFVSWKLTTSFLQKLPFALRHYKWYLPLMRTATERFDFRQYDVVISDTSAFVKGIRVPPSVMHISYIHTPTRWIWTERDDYINRASLPSWVKPLARWYAQRLARWDLAAAKLPYALVANSQNVRERIKRLYGRDAQVIYPPIDTEFFSPDENEGTRSYFLFASRLEPYKRIDLVVDAFNRLGLPLKVAGVGTQFAKLRTHAKANAEFLGRVSDEELRDLYRHAWALVYPAEEDAGMMLVEAQATGTPVIAYGKGGAIELVREGETGVFFPEQTSRALAEAVQKFRSDTFSLSRIREHARHFSKENFIQSFRAHLERQYRAFQKK